MPHNLERSAFRPGEYVAYGVRVGYYRVRRRPAGSGWYAARYVDRYDVGDGYVYGRTLAEVAAKVAELI